MRKFGPDPIAPPRNPFAVQTPEDISAEEALRLFVDVFSDFHKIREPGHCFVNGPRGCGKSMMFRYLLPDCQLLARREPLAELPFLGVLVSIKNTDLNLTELRRLIKTHANVLLNEHLLVLYALSKVFSTLSRLELPHGKTSGALRRFVGDFFTKLSTVGWDGDVAQMSKDVSKSPPKAFQQLTDLCDALYGNTLNYIRRLTFQPKVPPVYTGPLCAFLDFFLPVIKSLRDLPFMPNGPIYLLVDDADYLNSVQTRVLNSWISTRSSQLVSIKVSTQLRYKTFQTTSGLRIESPHDYSEINIADIYTSSQSKYMKRMTEIVEKRLRAAGIRATPQTFFPEDAEQELEIKNIGESLRRDWALKGRGHRASDDVLRYARPMYMASLRGKRKAGSSYSYAGFAQLVHISSGLVRYFLEPAAQMFSEELASHGGRNPGSISPAVQDSVIRRVADNLMFGDYDKMFEAPELSDAGRVRTLDMKAKLHNLLEALGGVFQQKLLSADSERRVFSVAFSDPLSPDLEEVFKLGIQLGFFHKSSIGNKDGTGRTALYVLTRRLAPHFGLDPTGFAGYLFMPSEKVREAISNPSQFLRRVKSRGVGSVFEQRQLQLFEG